MSNLEDVTVAWSHSSSGLGDSHKARKTLGIRERLKKHFENRNAESY